MGKDSCERIVLVPSTQDTDIPQSGRDSQCWSRGVVRDRCEDL